MIHVLDNVQIPVVVLPTRGKFDIYVPDFDMTVHGASMMEAMAQAMTYASAIYYYNKERSVNFSLSTKYEDAQKFCKGRKSFVTFINLTA